VVEAPPMRWIALLLVWWSSVGGSVPSCPIVFVERAGLRHIHLFDSQPGSPLEIAVVTAPHYHDEATGGELREITDKLGREFPYDIALVEELALPHEHSLLGQVVVAPIQGDPFVGKISVDTFQKFHKTLGVNGEIAAARYMNALGRFFDPRASEAHLFLIHRLAPVIRATLPSPNAFWHSRSVRISEEMRCALGDEKAWQAQIDSDLRIILKTTKNSIRENILKAALRSRGRRMLIYSHDRQWETIQSAFEPSADEKPEP
jgi:hypothetical protein